MDVGKGVIYVDVPPVLDSFINNLAKAIRFKEYVSITESLKRKILGNGGFDEQSRFSRVLDAFERGARKYEAKNSKPPVLILDNISGRVHDLKTYGNKIKIEGATFEVIRKIVLSDIKNNFHQAQMMKGEANHVIGKTIVQKMVENEKIPFDTFIELVNNKKIADELLQANVFSYNPKNETVTFQSRATEVFVKEVFT
ncbi:hypothetical protein C1646_774011 [Rhizophagus diaphanus]|nr:hypothetical protein C1646_774011 [Rhizophagus diaphanus] [Rhizophagus sp. MUCL 43196]